jgi:3-hydroxybutyryl-CoA dehydrogenase
LGAGIALAFALAGQPVILADVKERPQGGAERALAGARDSIAADADALAGCGLHAATAHDDLLARIAYVHGAEADAAIGRAELVFECVPEVMELKHATLARIAALASPEAVVASTTSTFLVEELAGQYARPERFLNTHWLNPAYLMPLVEVSPAAATAPETLARTLERLESAGKVPVTVASSPGFIVPRLQALIMNEAARMAEEGIATPADIDRAARLGLGLRFSVLGPLEFIDWGGADILLYGASYLRDALDAPRYDPPPVVGEHVDSGAIGLKTGRGFYNRGPTDLPEYQRRRLADFVAMVEHLGRRARDDA